MTRRSSIKIVITFALALSVLVGSIGIWPVSGQADTVTDVEATASIVNLREGPSTGYDVVGSLKKGQSLPWMKTVSGWYQVELASGKTAYITDDYSKLTKTTVSDKTVEATASIVNLRKGPSTSYAVYGSLKKGESLPWVKTLSGWYEVKKADGTTAYITADYSRLTEAAAPEPTPEPSPTPDPTPAPEPKPAVSTPNTVADVDKPYVDAFRKSFDGSLAQTLVGRAIWYMEYGYMVYGHEKYWDTGYIDCSNFVSLVYKDFGYTITSASRKYTTVGTRVEGVSAQKISGSSKYQLVGVDKLKPGDIFTFWAKDSNGEKYISHVALYMGKINGKPAIINTREDRPTAIGLVTDFSYWYGSNLYDVRRVLPSSAQVKGAVTINDNGPVIPPVYKMKKGTVILPKDLPQGF